jgi:type IV pilus assembly protein PilP
MSMSTHAMMCRMVVALAVVMVAACTPSESTQEWVAREKAKKGAPLQPLPVVKTFENFLYTAQDDRDPFGYSLEEQEQDANSGPRPDQNRPRELLESFPLDGLKMSGTLGTAAAMEALIRDPEGVVHRVRLGTYLGQNYGRVTAIEEDHVDLVELVPNGTGGWMERPATMALDSKQ